MKNFIVLCLVKLVCGSTDPEPEEVELVSIFDKPVKHTIGLVLMCTLLVLSSAGGISGAGSTVPIMLIFFDQSMP